jgi:hypothetical protein
VSNPYAGGPDEPGRIRGWAVAIGIIVGIVGTVIWMTVVFVIAYSIFSTEQSRSGAAVDVLVFVLFILPLPLAILLLCFRRTRQAAAGLVMGLAIGTLVLAGLCSGLVALPALGA